MVTLNVTQHKTNFKYVHLVRNVRFIESLSNEPIFEGNFGMMGVSLIVCSRKEKREKVILLSQT